ncbi:ribosomal protein [Nesidiocoris tenuis]|nr:ribosomal protein [Nesidiocoris tenuis]
MRSAARPLSSSAKTRQIEPLTVPSADGAPQQYSVKIEKLVEEISKMTLLEVSELSTALKTRLNLPDAPVMMGGFAPAAAPKDEEEEAPKAVQTSFTVKLMKFDEKQKVALIKECKALLDDMNLVQAKKFVESAPVVVKADIGKDEAEKLKEALSKVGGEVVVE